ncbi:MAG: DMT family transporter [Bacillaceae bacterium]|nr:DMT family transporter [Bacillaceae bacterium]
MKNEKPLFPPYLALIMGVIFISTSAILVRWSTAPAEIIAFYRLLFTFVFMLPLLLTGRRLSLDQMKKKHWLLSIVSGVMLAYHFIFWFISLELTSVASSVVLVCLSPIFTLVGGRLFFNEKPGVPAIVGSLTAISGGMIIGWGDFAFGIEAVIGDLLAFLAAFFIAVYWMIGQSLRKVTDSYTYTFVVYGASTVVLLVYSLFIQKPLFAYPYQEWLIFVALAVFPTLLGHSVFNWSLKYVSASVVSVSVLGEALGAALLAYLLLGETISLQQGIGGIILLTGIILFNRYQQ